MIEETLKDLLYEEEMVVVPGLGAFLTQPTPAEVNYGSHQITPPSKSIVFNPKVLSGGNILTEALAAQTGANVQAARERIENFVDLIKEQLSISGRASLGQIGDLNLGADGILFFDVNPKLNLNLESFGLESLHVVPVALQVRKQNERKGFVVPIDATLSSNAARRNGAKVRSLVAKALPLAASLSGILIAGAAIYWLNTGRPNTDVAGFNPLIERPLISKVNENARKGPAQSEIIANVSKPTLVKEPIKPTKNIEENTLVVAKLSTSYFVVSGSFSKIENIQKMKVFLTSKGLNPIEMEDKTPSGATRIAAGLFSSKEEAKEFIAQRQTEFDEQLWIFSK